MTSFLRTSVAFLSLLAGLTPVLARAQVNPDCANPDVLILFDVSGSMGRHTTVGSKYNQAKAAISAATESTEHSIRYGLMVFPGPGAYPVRCGADDPSINIPIAENNWEPIYNFISPTMANSTMLSPTFFGGPRGDYDTPMYQALRAASEQPELRNPERREYILLITDGVQDCGNGGDYDTEPDTNPGVAYGQPGYYNEAEYLENRADLVSMVETLKARGVGTFVVGFGSGVDAMTLNALAVAGGTADPDCMEDCYFQADNQDELTTALGLVTMVVRKETCDGIDNDCDGEVDESAEVDKICETACGSGFETCLGGVYQACDAPVPSTDVCDGFDNDCDGVADEGCSCTVGATRGCGSDVGECHRGTQICSAQGVWQPCQGEIKPRTEVCDGFDDEDCDGLVDENCQCRNGATQSCGLAVGLCHLGTQTCSGGRWGACVGAVMPAEEVCDRDDNDCDGETDEHCGCVDGATRACGSSHGICSPGHQTCAGGEWGECEDYDGPQAEVCDNVDNDCDGEVDNGALCATGLACRCGACVGECAANNVCPKGSECVEGYCIMDTCPAGSYCDGMQCREGTNPNGGSTEDTNRGDKSNGSSGGAETGGCSCRASSTSPGAGALAFLVLGLALARRSCRRD